jgi:hypothetical protein
MQNATSTLIEDFLTDDALFANTVLTVKNKDMALTPFRVNPMQRHGLATMGRRNLWLKARQLGVSTLIQARFFRINITETSTTITISDTGDNTLKLRSIYNRFYDLWPDDLQFIRPVRDRDSMAWVTYPDNQSESGIITAGARTGGRGGTSSHIHGSEVAFWKNPDDIFAATMQSATPDAEIHLESTANGQQGMFYDLCMKAMDGDEDWRFHFYPWWWADEYATHLEPGEVIEYTDEEEDLIAKALLTGFSLTPEQIKWRRAKKREVGMALLFDQEYPESPQQAFLASGIGVFGSIDHCLLKEPAQTKPIPGHRYVAGADWGQSEDYSSISIMDATDDVEVHLDRFNRMEWDDMQARMVQACIYWGVETFQPEYNSIGRVNAENLRKKFEVKDYDINLRPVETTNDKKRKWVQGFYNSVHYEGLRLLDPIDDTGKYATAELHGFSQKQTPTGEYKYEAAGSGHDDTVIARLLADDARRKVVV